MTEREQEHYEIASRCGQKFSRSQFVKLYQQVFPDRKFNSIMPYEFCGNRHIATARSGPKFLNRLAPGQYEFIGSSDRN